MLFIVADFLWMITAALWAILLIRKGDKLQAFSWSMVYLYAFINLIWRIQGGS